MAGELTEHVADIDQRADGEYAGRWFVTCSCGWAGRTWGYRDWSFARGGHTRHRQCAEVGPHGRPRR